jgi:CRP-like cAMP-binding protein
MPKTYPLPEQAGNQLLTLLPRGEYQRLSPHLQALSLPVKQVLYAARSPIDYVYFPISGVISAMAVMEDGSAIEVATIGNEGMAGLTAFIGGETSPYEVMVQVEGEAIRMRADVLKHESRQDGPLRRLMVLYNTAFSTQVSYSVACNGLHKVEKRCCRWLLMTADRMESDTLPLTHEFLAIMLGVRRPSVTEVLQPLQARGLIQNGRGKITIVDRPGLEAAACECYRVVKEEFARLFGSEPAD